MARQRYCRRLARYRNTLSISADAVAKPAGHTRAESRDCRPTKDSNRSEDIRYIKVTAQDLPGGAAPYDLAGSRAGRRSLNVGGRRLRRSSCQPPNRQRPRAGSRGDARRLAFRRRTARTRARSSRGPNGLVTQSSAPSSSPETCRRRIASVDRDRGDRDTLRCRPSHTTRHGSPTTASPLATRQTRAAEPTSTASTFPVPRSRPSERRPCR
jgi:hypothetical protein